MEKRSKRSVSSHLISPSCTVRVVRRAGKLGALAHAHVHHTLVPALDDAAKSDVVAEGLLDKNMAEKRREEGERPKLRPKS